MALRPLSSAPNPSDFTPLQEHQEQTPSTFFGSKPVLYARYADLTLSLQTSKLQADPAIGKFAAEEDEGTEDSLVKGVEIWVSSEDLILFQHPPTPTGISIPYPSIALHATMKWKSQVEALYMNISLNDAENVNDEEDIQVLEITVLPPNYSSSTTASSTSTTSPDSNTESNTACIKDIFSAMNTCADLHPDPDASDAEDEEDDTAPGATGWITADNMDEYLDEDGNFRGPVLGGEEELGPGAGTVRQREDEDGEGHVNGVNGVDGETKWQRTD